MMHGRGKSDSAIVAVKPANKAEPPTAEPSVVMTAAAEPVERRAGTKGNADWQSTHQTQRWVGVSQALDRMRQMIAVGTRGRSRMRESCTYGSVRGVPSNGHPYRHPVVKHMPAALIPLPLIPVNAGIQATRLALAFWQRLGPRPRGGERETEGCDSTRPNSAPAVPR